MATDFVIDADAGHDPDALPPVAVRIDGQVYQAHCPKDSVVLLMAEMEKRAEDPDAQRAIIHDALRMILDEDDADTVMGKVLDLGNRRIGIQYVFDLVEKIGAHYEPLLAARREEMGMAEPANRQQRRAAVKKAAAKKTAAKKTTAARRTASR